jgi:hypothetical protein
MKNDGTRLGKMNDLSKQAQEDRNDETGEKMNRQLTSEVQNLG